MIVGNIVVVKNDFSISVWCQFVFFCKNDSFGLVRNWKMCLPTNALVRVLVLSYTVWAASNGTWCWIETLSWVIHIFRSMTLVQVRYIFMILSLTDYFYLDASQALGQKIEYRTWCSSH